MHWFKIEKVIPGTTRKVLLCGVYNRAPQYAIGDLGSEMPRPIIATGPAKDGEYKVIDATYWCELGAPQEYKLWEDE